MRRKPTIAIVNNERMLVTWLRMAFDAEGFLVRCYLNTDSALELLDDPADIALLDKTNRPLDGIAFFKRLRARHRMPVIFLTPWAEEVEEQLKGTSWEAEAYYPSPFSQGGIVANVREVLRQYPPKPTIVLVSPRN